MKQTDRESGFHSEQAAFRGEIAREEEIQALLTRIIRDPETKLSDCMKAVEMLVKYTGMFSASGEETPVLRVELSDSILELSG